MIRLADNITSPLGLTTDDNYRAVSDGRSCLRRYEGLWDIPEPFTASLFSAGALRQEGLTRWESLVVSSISEALSHTNVDPSSPRVLFILATAKGNVELIEDNPQRFPAERALLPIAAGIVSRHFGNPVEPLVVSNACTSGVCAQIAAMRALARGRYDYAVVAGAEVQSRFIVSGFQSFKALSADECRPFDIDRKGLNLGEAAATIIYGRTADDGEESHGWYAVSGAMRNDAYHISSPSARAAGAVSALRAVTGGMADTSDLAFINLHGTATLFNDEMEATAVSASGLASLPVNALKGYYGHTMGAAGVLETILSMRGLDNGLLLGTRGFSESGVSRRLNISGESRPVSGRSFVKLISGFGGSNAAMLFTHK